MHERSVLLLITKLKTLFKLVFRLEKSYLASSCIFERAVDHMISNKKCL